MADVKKLQRLKGYVGHVEIDESGNVKESENVKDAKALAEILAFNVRKGNEEAKELGFSRMSGFAMIGENRSLAFMKGLGVIVETDKADWQELFTFYTYVKSFLIGGISLIVLGVILIVLWLTTPPFSTFATDAKVYITILTFLVGSVLLAASKSSMAYRL